MKKTIFLMALASLLPILSGCIANTYDLSEQEQIKAIEKYPRTGLNLQPEDGFFSTTGKVLARTILCPLTLAISEGSLLTEREHSFSSYALDLYKERKLKETKTFYDALLGKTEGEVLVELGQPTDRKNFQDGTTILFYKSEKKQATPLFIPGIILHIPRTQKYVRSSNDDKGNYKINPINSNNDFDCIYLNAEKKCSAWNVKKPEATSVYIINGNVKFE